MKTKYVGLDGIVVILVGGLLTLAVIDKDYRSSFVDLGKFGVGSYIGLMIAKSEEGVRLRNLSPRVK